jgi:hypothetical protein
MPIIDDLELPIKRTIITGPAVDALENRKECGTIEDTEALANEILANRVRGRAASSEATTPAAHGNESSGTVR